jgi:hypothetical protein
MKKKIKKKSLENLIPQNKRSKAERKRIAKLGAQASNKAQKLKKTFREIAGEMLKARPGQEIIDKIKIICPDLNEKDINIKAASVFGLFKESMKGNVAAFSKLEELEGEAMDKSINVKATINGELGLQIQKPDIKKIKEWRKTRDRESV